MAAFVATPSAAGVNPPSYLGPDPYTSELDSPFGTGSFGFCIEDFENGMLDVPGVTGNAGVFPPTGVTDSVDGDDGAIDGSGTGGHSYFNGSGGTIVFEFDLNRTNGLPTSVGIVWTDGGFEAAVTFEAFGPDNESVLDAPYGPFLHSDGGNGGGTAEDRFYGVTSSGGIRKIMLTSTGGGIEVDHLQLDKCTRCGDANLDLSITAPDALIALKSSVGSDECLLCICDTNDSEENTVSDALAILQTSVGLTPALSCPPCPPIV